MAGEVRTPSVKARMAFLQAVVSGRGTPSQQFKDWFPEFPKGSNINLIRSFSVRAMAREVWQHPQVRPFTPPKDDGHIYEEMLRYKLRVIWHRATSGNNPQAAVLRLRSDIRDFFHKYCGATRDIERPPNSLDWESNASDALMWLERNTHKLRLCAIADCKCPYFIVTPSRKKYCSDYCQELAEVERSKERVKAAADAKRAAMLNGQGIKKPRLTPEGSARISRAVKAKWEKRRREKRRSRTPS